LRSNNVELLVLIGGIELGQSLPHQVSNAKVTNLTLLHDGIRRVELGALLLDGPPFVSEFSL
jgi:hypothetical protein